MGPTTVCYFTLDARFVHSLRATDDTHGSLRAVDRILQRMTPLAMSLCLYGVLGAEMFKGGRYPYIDGQHHERQPPHWFPSPLLKPTAPDAAAVGSHDSRFRLQCQKGK